MPWPLDPCSTCPRAREGLPLPCQSQATRHRRLCDLANPAHPDHAPAYVAVLCDRIPEPEIRTPPAPPPLRVEPEPPPDPPPPSVLARAASFGSAVVAHALAGLPTVDEAEYQRRLSLCPGCAQTCPHCGCHMPTKMRWADQHCPIGKW